MCSMSLKYIFLFFLKKIYFPKWLFCFFIQKFCQINGIWFCPFFLFLISIIPFIWILIQNIFTHCFSTTHILVFTLMLFLLTWLIFTFICFQPCNGVPYTKVPINHAKLLHYPIVNYIVYLQWFSIFLQIQLRNNHPSSYLLTISLRKYFSSYFWETVRT